MKSGVSIILSVFARLWIGLALVLGLVGATTDAPAAQAQARPEAGSVAGITAAMGTAFTYQGQLIKNGEPVNDTCDFLFLLYDAPIGGSPVGDTQEKPAVTVTGGIFTIPNLDFGNGAFNGEARWLLITVRCPINSGAYTSIGPRQELSPTPYALHAGRATFASTAAWGGLIGVPAGFADNVDNDTTYTTDFSLALAGTQLSIAPTFQLPQGCSAADDIARWNDSLQVWQCSGDEGDITSVSSGAGLTGGGIYGAVTLAAHFDGSGSATTIARSDHNHWGAAWAGSGTGLSLTGGTAGIHVDGSTADLDLGGSTGTIVADDTVGADLKLYSNDEVEVHLDENNDSDSSFRIFNGAGTSVFQVDEAGVMTWTSWPEQTGYLSVPATAFRPQYGSAIYTDLGFYLWPRDVGGGIYRAPVYLPQGAVVTKMTFYWSDRDASGNATCTLNRNPFGSISEYAMATASRTARLAGAAAPMSRLTTQRSTTPITATISPGSSPPTPSMATPWRSSTPTRGHIDRQEARERRLR